VRIGVDERFMGEYVHPDVVTALIAALDVLQREGAAMVRVTIPVVEELLEAWPVICSAEAVAAHEATYPARAEEYGPGFRSFLEYGTCVSGAEYAKAHLLRAAFARRFQQVLVASSPAAGGLNWRRRRADPCVIGPTKMLVRLLKVLPLAAMRDQP
jgi:Asp-tRNA(Asn)/Glu-tRNA(Gln) amidotransferase A subunit family amidase